MQTISDLKTDLHRLANPEKKKILQKFFKTAPGQYGEGDIFLGISVPESRNISKKYENLSFKDTTKLLDSKIHEERLVAILLLVQKFKKTKEKKQIVDFYLKHIKKINNWDLVDLSAPKILGMYLLDKDKSILYKLSELKNLWEKRIGIISTHPFILNNKLKDTLKISEILLNDENDLIHKAVGWMLREVGKKDVITLEKFLKKHYKKMPRTMLRYTIEKFPEKTRKSYLNSLV
jgi:3-methyladenine DNA glycosylase AlkD